MSVVLYCAVTLKQGTHLHFRVFNMMGQVNCSQVTCQNQTAFIELHKAELPRHLDFKAETVIYNVLHLDQTE